MDDLLYAINSQDVNKLKEILCIDPNAIEKRDENGVCTAFLAAKTGNLEMVRYIVEYSRASMNCVDDMNRNILHYAAYSDSLVLIEYLVERVGLSPLAGDRNRITPFHIAQQMGHKQIEAYFEKVCGSPLSGMYQNPIRPGTYPDPSIVRVGEDYYMVNSSFIYFPAIPISHSKDLINWHITGHAINDIEWAGLKGLESGRGYWAPDISYYKGRFYITATYRMNDGGAVCRKQIVVSAEHPEGPYSKPVFFDEDGIDPSIFNDDDGRRYMLLNRGARIFEIDEGAQKQISEAELLWYGDNKRAPEGPHLLKKDGFYYLFLAEGGTGTGHRISVARSKQLMGPYESCPYNPILKQNDSRAIIQRAGHGKPVQTQNGQWFMVYLCGRTVGEGYSILGRETAIDPITWTEDGWPLVNDLRGPSVLQIKPDLPACRFEEDFHDDFDNSALGLEWMAPRAVSANHCFVKDNGLHMIGNGYDLCNAQVRSILVKRQKGFSFLADTCFEICKLDEHENTGMTCYYDENTYLKYGLFFEGGAYWLQVVERVGADEKQSFKTRAGNQGKLFLRIETSYLLRKFYYSYDGAEWSLIGMLDNVYYLCDEGYDKGKRFTGAMLGVYAAGRAEATFDYFHIDYREEPVL